MENRLTVVLQEMGIDILDAPALHWIILIIGIMCIFYGSALLCRHVIIPIVKTLTKRTATRWDDIILNEKTIRSFCNLLPIIIVMVFVPFIISKGTLGYTITMKVCWVYLTAVSVRLTCAILSSLYIISHESEKTKNHTLQGVFQMLKIVAICVGGIIVISTLIDKNPVTILAGLGASAAVLMLVFKDSIMGLVAGVQLSANDMLRPGDWIEMPKYGADGTVVEVTLTTVKVQNWDKSITTIPPYALVSDSFQNWRGMWSYGGRRIKRSIFLDMNSIVFCDNTLLSKFKQNGWLKDTNEDNKPIVNLTIFRCYLEDYLRNHKDINSEMMIMVRQLQPTPQGVPLELYFFFNGINWVPYEHLQAEIMEYVFAILPEFGLRVFQSPAGRDFAQQNPLNDIIIKS